MRAEGYLNFISHSRSCFHSGMARKFQDGRRLELDWAQTPGPEFALDVDYGLRVIEVHHIDGKPHS